MKNLSLRLRLVIIFTLTAIVVWTVAGAVSYKETRETIDEFFDTYQMALGRQLATADWHSTSFDKQKTINKLIGNVEHAEEDDEAIGFAIFGSDGRVVFHDNLNGKNFKFSSNIGSFSNEHIKNEDDIWRIMRLKTADGAFVVAVGQELEYREDLALDIVEEFLLPWLIGFFVLLLLIIWLTFRAFRPLKRLSRRIGSRNADDFTAINSHDAPAEIKPLLIALNKMFSKIEEMIKRERCFISDSAHELRTPLTALKIQLELAEMAENDEALRREALKKLEQGLERSIHLVEQLLALSRIEANNGQYSNTEVLDWSAILEAIFNDYKDIMAKKQIKLMTHISDSVPFKNGNTILVSLMARNLIDNAVKYSDNGVTVTVKLENGVLMVCNSNTKVDENILEHLSERFFRPAGQKENGSGLGLAIVERISKIYGCTLNFNNSNEGFVVTIKKE